MPRLFIAALICALLSAPAAATAQPAAATKWRIVGADSHIAFHGSMLGVAVTGYFRDFAGEITFDPDDLENAHLSILIDMASVDTAHDERDTALGLPEWFAARSHASAEFTAGEFRRTGDGAFEAIGTLTIKGVSKEITLPFSLETDGSAAVVSGQVMLNRRDFNIGSGDWTDDRLVAFDVRVEFHIVARALAPR